ncbi:MAG TPA: dipeptidase [Victivallales bacterium]|nr:dipeptidase [Victivallales bacterium]
MNVEQLHKELIVFDGLVVAEWSKDVFEDMHRGGITAANCTCSIWENFNDTMDNISQFKQMINGNKNIITQVFCAEDIKRAKTEDKIGICLGWQNTSGIEDKIEYLQLFKELGVGIMQMTYNTQNYVGSGCYESRDGGLSDFGKEVVAEMNNLGILCDLSHVGPNTTHDVIKHSKKPVAYSHVLPVGINKHPRNKSDDQLKFIADNGGFVGVTMFPPFLKNGGATINDYIEAIEYVIDIVGEDHVGIGSDFTQGRDVAFFDFITHDKGYGRKLVDMGEINTHRLKGLETLGDYSNLTAALIQFGWSEQRIRKIMGENWVNLLKEVWGN